MNVVRSRNAFTLVEIVVVLAILGLTASIVAMNLRGPLRNARVNTAIQQLLSIDQLARNESKKHDVHLSLESKDYCLASLTDGNDASIRTWSLPRSVQVSIAGEPTTDRTMIKYSQVGGSKDLVIEVSEGNVSKKLYIAGSTGHSLVLAGTSHGR